MKKRFVVIELALILALTLLLTACGAVSASEDVVLPEKEEAVTETQEPAETAKPAAQGKDAETTPTPQKCAEPAKEAAEPTSKDAAKTETAQPPVTQGPATAPVPVATPAPAQQPSVTPAPAPAPTPTAAHTHTWQPVYTTVHHDAVTEEVWVVDRDAYDQPIQEYKVICRCGAVFASGEEWDAHSRCFFDTPEEENHSSHSVAPVIVGYEYYDEIGHYETVTIQEAWDEKILDYYACSCGEKKKP